MNSDQKRIYRFACKYARKLNKQGCTQEGIKNALQINYPSIDANEILALLNEIGE